MVTALQMVVRTKHVNRQSVAEHLSKNEKSMLPKHASSSRSVLRGGIGLKLKDAGS